MAKILGIHTPQDGRNLLLNPEMWLFQRTDPTTPTARTNTQYGPDRWKMLMENSGVNISRSSTVPARSRYSLLLAKTTSTGRMGMMQAMEADESIPLRGKTVTFTIQVQSPSSNVANVRVALLSWAGTADTITADPISVWAAAPTYAANFTQIAFTEITVTNAFQSATVSGIVPGSCNNLIAFVWTPTQEASGDSIILGAATMALGATALPFNKRSDEDELARCQRFYETTVAGAYLGVGRIGGASDDKIVLPFLVEKRVAPTITASGSFTINDGSVASSAPFNAVDASTTRSAGITFVGSGHTSGKAGLLFSTTGVLFIDAEL